MTNRLLGITLVSLSVITDQGFGDLQESAKINHRITLLIRTKTHLRHLVGVGFLL